MMVSALLVLIGGLVLFDLFGPLVEFVAAWFIVATVVIMIAIVVNAITHAIDPAI